MAVDLVATEVIITLGLVIAGILTWPSTPWDALWKASIAAALILPLALNRSRGRSGSRST